MKIAFIADDKTQKELLYDELKMITSFNVKAENDIMYMNILTHKINQQNKFGQRTQPIRNSLKLTPNEYREFLSTFGFTTNYLKKWLNDVVLRNGVRFPYNVYEFDTHLEFKEHSIHVMMEVNDEAAEFLEEDFWDK